MIIRRQYELLGVLIQRDPKAKKIIDEVCEGLDPYTYQYNFSPDSEVSLHKADMGCCIPGDMFAKLLKEMNRLDEKEPYDNGLTYRDVTDIGYEASRKGSAIRLVMKSRKVEQPERIVQVVVLDQGDVSEDWGTREHGFIK